MKLIQRFKNDNDLPYGEWKPFTDLYSYEKQLTKILSDGDAVKITIEFDSGGKRQYRSAK